MTQDTGMACAPGRPCYLLPLRWQENHDTGKLTAYLRRIAEGC
jgi:hypothetical protein